MSGLKFLRWVARQELVILFRLHMPRGFATLLRPEVWLNPLFQVGLLWLVNTLNTFRIYVNSDVFTDFDHQNTVSIEVITIQYLGEPCDHGVEAQGCVLFAVSWKFSADIMLLGMFSIGPVLMRSARPPADHHNVRQRSEMCRG